MGFPIMEYFFISKVSAGASQLYLAALVQVLPILWLKGCSWGLFLHCSLGIMGAQGGNLLPHQAELPIVTATAKPICHLSKVCFHSAWNPVPGFC